MYTTFKILLLCITILTMSCQEQKDFAAKEVAVEVNKTPLMGWASWNNYRININEDIIKAQADAFIALGLDTVGYQFVNIDDGFFGGRDEDGNLLVHPERFPNGMKALADYIHQKGLKAGIYSDAGINTCASKYDRDTIGAGMGLWGHENEDLTLFLKDWDYDFIKIDWCGGKWLGLDEESRYTEIGQIARSIKPDVIYNVCRWEFPGKWVTKIADSWRISSDIRNRFKSIMHIVDINADLWQYASYGHYNDMDMLQVGRGMSFEEDKTHFTMWSIMHSPLLLGNDLTNVSDETLSIIKNEDIIALNQTKFVYQARRLVDNGDLEIWGKPLISTMSGEVAVVLLNRTKEEQEITMTLKDVGIDASQDYTMKDLWSKKEYEKSNEDSQTMLVPAHGVVALKIKGVSLPFNPYQFSSKKDK